MKNIKKLKNNEKEMSIKEFLNSNFYDPFTVLHYAAAGDNPLLIRQAIKFGADVNKRDALGRTALFYCSCKSNAQELIKAGADPNILSNAGETAVARFHIEHVDVVKYLAEVSDLDLRGAEGSTILQKLISQGINDYELIDLVLSRTKNKDILLDDKTLLFCAAKTKNYKDIIVLLAKSGMNLHFRDKNGKDFYDYCYKNVKKEIRKQMPEFIKEREKYNAYNK